MTTFLILEYIDGKHLRTAELEIIAPHEKLNLLSSLADIYVQLRQQEFPTIGRLNGSTSEPSVGQKTVSIEMNMLQLEGLTPFSLQDTYHNEHGVLRSATSYTNMLLCIGYNAFVKSSDAVEDGMGLEAVYNYSLFIKHAKKWIDPTLDQGPFVLVHGDLHLSNLVVDDDLRIIGVLDWEWSRVVPPQYFTPPLWLSGYGAVQLAHHISWQLFRETALAEFLAIIKTREQALCGNTQLHDEWLQTVNHGEPLVANAVENWTEVDWFVHRGLHKKQAPSEEALSAFVEEDPSRALFAHIQEHDHDRSTKELVHSKVDERRKKLHESKVWRIMERISHLPRQASAAANIIGWSVAACLVIAAFWRRA